MFRCNNILAAALVLMLCATPCMAQNWFRIDLQDGSDNNPSELKTGMLVHFYDAWSWKVAPAATATDGPHTYEPGPPRGGGDREPEFMVEVLADHHVTNDFVVRLIATHVGAEARYLKWSPGTLGPGQAALHDDASVNPWLRGKEKLDDAYEMRLERFRQDANRFYVTFLGADGTKYYLRSDQTDNPLRRRLSFTPARGEGGGTSPPDRFVTLPTGRQGAHDFFFDIISTELIDTLIGKAEAVGPAEVVASSQKLDATPDLAAHFTRNNPSSEPQEYAANSVDYTSSTTDTAEFHWDVGITLTASVSYMVASVSMSITTNFGGKTATSKAKETKISIAIPATTVPGHHTRSMSATLKTTTYKQPFQMKLRRQVKSRFAAVADQYILEIVGEVFAPRQAVESVSWDDPKPYSG